MLAIILDMMDLLAMWTIHTMGGNLVHLLVCQDNTLPAPPHSLAIVIKYTIDLASAGSSDGLI